MTSTTDAVTGRRTTRPVLQVGDRIFANLAKGAGVLILVVLAGVAVFLIAEAFPALVAPASELPEGHGLVAYIAPLVFGTVLSAAIALLVAGLLAIVGLCVWQVRAILRSFGRDEDDIEWVTDRAGHDRRYAIESGKLRSELGWTPQYQDFEAGLADTIAWYQANEAWWRPAKAATEAAYAAKGQ